MSDYAFQTATINAICRHLKEHDRALCADEAGLGKTFVAKGVIARMAEEHARAKCAQPEVRENLLNWWDAFSKKYAKSDDYQRERLRRFARELGLSIDARGSVARNVYTALERRMKELSAVPDDAAEFCLKVVRCMPELMAQQGKNGGVRRSEHDFWYPEKTPKELWQFPVEPFRVLYICCNLAIAEQNTKKLSGFPQRSVRSGGDKADRLSVLWYYLELYGTPYVELYPITSTVSTRSTAGTENERTIIKHFCNDGEKATCGLRICDIPISYNKDDKYKTLRWPCVIAQKGEGTKVPAPTYEELETYKKECAAKGDRKNCSLICTITDTMGDGGRIQNVPWPCMSELRERGERCSLKKLKPDLVIFDEFQNFGTMVTLAKADETAFKKLLDKLKAKRENLEEDTKNLTKEEKQERLEEIEDREEALKRIYKTCQELYGDRNTHPTKTLMLSATPFHAVEEGEGENAPPQKLDLENIIAFLGTVKKAEDDGVNGIAVDGADVYKRYQACASNQDREKILYEECGIFRTERRRLMPGHSSENHLMKFSGLELLNAAVLLKAGGQGNRGYDLILTTPDAVNNNGKTRYGAERRETNPLSPEELQGDAERHPRYQALKKVVCSPEAPIDAEPASRQEETIQCLQKVLWLPAMAKTDKPETETEKVYAQFKNYSKTLVYSSLAITPKKVCEQLNRAVKTTPRNVTKEEKDQLMKLFSGEEWNVPEKAVGKLIAYLEAYGGSVVGNLCDYCRESGLRQVLAEYRQNCDDNGFDYEKALFDVLEYAVNVAKGNKAEPSKGGFAVDMDMASLNGGKLRLAFNSPFRPFVLMTTSIGAEGLDFHLYCNRLAHYTLPAGAVQLEQKNGRVDRRKSFAVRLYQRDNGSTDEVLNEKSGQLAPDWYAGEGNLHYYFFVTEGTQEERNYQQLQKELRKYRTALGIFDQNSGDVLNLCPLLREGKPGI